jgi:hypothetical protein
MRQNLYKRLGLLEEQNAMALEARRYSAVESPAARWAELLHKHNFPRQGNESQADIEATAAQLMEESTKARENGERYAQMTAENASAAVARRERSRA